MENYNVLILSAGRRVELVQAFKSAAKQLNIESKIIAADNSKLAPALYFADEYELVSRIDSGDYISNIIDIANKHNIKMIIPTIDTELLILSENKDIIHQSTSAKVLISDLELIRICRDKIKTSAYLEKNGFNVPKLYGLEEAKKIIVNEPLFIKPVSGSSSINAFKVTNLDELVIYSDLIKEFMIQEYISGDEYTIDIFLDDESNPITIVPRLRIATRAGEISKGKIIKDQTIIDEIKKLVSVMRFIGHITVQLKKDNEKIVYIEINPRFGGGTPMSIAAGADSCRNIFKLLKGETLKYNEDYKDDITFLRYDSSVMIHD